VERLSFLKPAPDLPSLVVNRLFSVFVVLIRRMMLRDHRTWLPLGEELLHKGLLELEVLVHLQGYLIHGDDECVDTTDDSQCSVDRHDGVLLDIISLTLNYTDVQEWVVKEWKFWVV
jgi:hypothetical protein